MLKKAILSSNNLDAHINTIWKGRKKQRTKREKKRKEKKKKDNAAASKFTLPNLLPKSN